MVESFGGRRRSRISQRWERSSTFSLAAAADRTARMFAHEPARALEPGGQHRSARSGGRFARKDHEDGLGTVVVLAGRSLAPAGGVDETIVTGDQDREGVAVAGKPPGEQIGVLELIHADSLPPLTAGICHSIPPRPWWASWMLRHRVPWRIRRSLALVARGCFTGTAPCAGQT